MDIAYTVQPGKCNSSLDFKFCRCSINQANLYLGFLWVSSRFDTIAT